MHPDQKGSDTLSEVSDGGTAGTSVSGQGSSYGESSENLRELVTTLGLSAIDELYEERFRVDRRKLEHMILGMNSFPEHMGIFVVSCLTAATGTVTILLNCSFLFHSDIT